MKILRIRKKCPILGHIKLWNLKNMEEFKKKSAADGDKEIVFSKAIKAGKRIYYLDVKKNRKDEMFLAITESKKIISGEGEDSQVSFEKHKIFLYKEDFEKFAEGLEEVISYIRKNCLKDSGKGDNFSNVEFEGLPLPYKYTKFILSLLPINLQFLTVRPFTLM